MPGCYSWCWSLAPGNKILEQFLVSLYVKRADFALDGALPPPWRGGILGLHGF
jgi:hypothetical protein